MATEFSDRITHSVIDELGIDPLLDSSWDAIQGIKEHTEYVVDQTEEKNVPLISFRFYGTYKYWWVIQMYNGLADSFTLKAGTILKMPSSASIISRLVDIQTKTQSSPPTVRI